MSNGQQLSPRRRQATPPPSHVVVQPATTARAHRPLLAPRRKTGLWRGWLTSIAVGLLLSTVLVGTARATGTAPGSSLGYAMEEDVCQQPSLPGEVACLAVRRVPVSKGTPGAEAVMGNPAGYSVGPAGGLTPADLASAYSFSPTATGTGQTVGIVDAFNDPNINSDLQVFDSRYGLSTCNTSNGCLSIVNEDGGTQLPPDDTSGWSLEESLDVETVHSVCEQCKVLLVEASSTEDSDVAQAEDEAVSLGADEVSNSFGAPESPTTPTFEAAFNHPGTVIAAPAGDDGYYSYDLKEATDEPLAPASFNTVVAVGGTSLSLDADGSRGSETVWNDNGPDDIFGSASPRHASGGGCGTLFAAQAWQTAVSDWASTGCGDMRLVSDVSADGDPGSGLDVYDSYSCPSGCSTGWETIGGTSLSTPIIAAMYGLAGGSHGVSYPAATLYSHLGTSALYDVTTGGDGWCDGESASQCGDPNNQGFGLVDCDYAASGSLNVGNLACDASTGYDGASGVGTPNGLGAFEPLGTPPIITAVSPGQGPTNGGTKVTITGADLSGATSVKFGATPAASFSVLDDAQVTAVSPPGALGTVDIRVTTPNGTSATSGPDGFTYVPSPVVTSVTPGSGAHCRRYRGHDRRLQPGRCDLGRLRGHSSAQLHGQQLGPGHGS